MTAEPRLDPWTNEPTRVALAVNPDDPWADPWSMPNLTQRIAAAVSLLAGHHCDSCARVITQAIEILGQDVGVSRGHLPSEREDGECAPEGAGNTRRDDLHSNRHYTEGGADPMMVAPPTQEHRRCRARHAEDAEIIRRLRTGLDRAIRQRESRDTRAAHWFVDDGAGYCQACGLPPANIRHVERAA